MQTLWGLLAAVLVAVAEASGPAPSTEPERPEGGQQSEPEQRLRRERPAQPFGSPPLPHDRRLPVKQYA